MVSDSVTEINGGLSHNVTPQKCRMTIDIRIPTHQSCEDILNLIDIKIAKIKKDKDSIVIKYHVEDKNRTLSSKYLFYLSKIIWYCLS